MGSVISRRSVTIVRRHDRHDAFGRVRNGPDHADTSFTRFGRAFRMHDHYKGFGRVHNGPDHA